MYVERSKYYMSEMDVRTLVRVATLSKFYPTVLGIIIKMR